MSKFIIGSHISMCAPEYFLGSMKESILNGANTLMFYTGAPQNSRRTPIEKCQINAAIEYATKNDFLLDKIVCHAPYIINLANCNDEKFEFSKSLLINEIDRCSAFHCKYLVFHPGAYLNFGLEKGLNQVIKGLNEIFDIDKSGVIVCLETMSGKGSEIGSKFSELAYIIKNIDKKERIGICFDTCHVNDAGYDLSNYNQVFDEFDKTIGLNYLKVIHLNDSKNIVNSHKDRHENIGFGTIGFDILNKIANDDRFKEIPKILETPWICGESPYKKEIEMLKNKRFNSNLKNDFQNQK